MKRTVDQMVSGEFSWVIEEIRSNPFSNVTLSFVVHEGKIVRVKRGVEIQEKLDDSSRKGAA
mgnify:CR=1 FL=1